MNKFLKSGLAAISLAIFINTANAADEAKLANPFNPEEIIRPAGVFFETSHIKPTGDWWSRTISSLRDKDVALEFLTNSASSIVLDPIERMQFLKFVSSQSVAGSQAAHMCQDRILAFLDGRFRCLLRDDVPLPKFLEEFSVLMGIMPQGGFGEVAYKIKSKFHEAIDRIA
ncbi:MAG: hypothetical protein LBU35_02245 [Holosporales bacterium]|jgi:hypothetical protein|nr:hypothetical protein [Holosporales bacterium]